VRHSRGLAARAPLPSAARDRAPRGPRRSLPAFLEPPRAPRRGRTRRAWSGRSRHNDRCGLSGDRLFKGAIENRKLSL